MRTRFARDLAKNMTLQPGYSGPFKILKKLEKFFEMEIKRLLLNIAADRLKPASLDAIWFSMDTLKTSPPPGVTVGKETIKEVWPLCACT